MTFSKKQGAGDRHQGDALDLPFKGSRQYLHGTDIIPAVLALTGSVEEVSFQIHRMAMYPLLVRWVDNSELEALRKSNALCLLMSYIDTEQERKTVAVVEDNSYQIDKRIPYDEEQVIAGASISGKTIVQKTGRSGSFIERVVALNKALILEVVGKCSLLLMRIDLRSMPVSPKEISITLTRVIGEKTFLSTISGDGDVLGTIYFSKRVV